MLLLNSLLFIGAFITIWLGSGLIVSSVDRFSHKLKISRFAVSFVILGLLTSTPELGVGLTSIASGDHQIFIGNLIGGVAVLFLFVIPILAIFGNGINLKHELGNKSILITLLIVMVPSLMTLNQHVSFTEGITLIIMYITLVFFVQRKHGIFDKETTQILHMRAYSYADMIKILIGIGLVFVSSSVIVNQTLYFSEIFHISTFIISLLLLSLGTNLPELSIAVRSVLSGKKDIALGDYLGSAAANTLIFGVLTTISEDQVITQNNFLLTFIFLLVGLMLFYFFSQIGNSITRKEGLVLLFVYLIFVCVESFSLVKI